MTDIFRRRLFGAAAATGLAAVPAHAARVDADEELLKKDYPAGRRSAALGQPDPMPEPEARLSGTYDLGASTVNEGEVINASRWGVVYAHVQGGKMTHLRPFEFDYAPSPNLNGLCHLPYSPSRIRQPMVREGWLKNGPKSRRSRGEEKFVPVSWEKALDLVAGEMKRVYKDYGPSAVFGRSYGWMSTGRVNAAINLQQRLLNLCGGFIQCENSYSTAAISKILPYVVGTGDPRSTSWDVVIGHSERVVFWGCDPLVTNDIDWHTTIHNATGYIRALRDKGVTTISINPVQTDTAEYLGSEWIAPRPGTDCAMMLGMMHELEATGKADHAFLEKCCSGWKELRAYIMGDEDGVAKTPEWAAEKTGVPAERIRKLAHDLHEHRTMLMVGWGIQRIQYGEQPHWMAFALASVLGQIGLPGGGIGTNYQYSNGGAPMAKGPFLAGVPAKVKPALPFNENWKGSTTIPVARFVECFLNPGKTIDFNGRKVTYPEVKLVMWAGGNPFAHQPDTMKLERAWKEPETVVVTDTVWTATARHADIVLPACTTFEHNDIMSIGTYTEGLDEMGWIRRLYEGAMKMGRAGKIAMPDFDEFWKKGYVMFDVADKDRNYVAFEAFRKDPKANALSTESGLIQLYSPKIASYGYDDCKGHPCFFEPTEGVSRATKDAPLALMACKSRYRMHSQLDGTVSHDFANIEDREPLWIHPDDAAARGMQACGAFSFMNGKSTARDEMFRQNSSPSAANSISFN